MIRNCCMRLTSPRWPDKRTSLHSMYLLFEHFYKIYRAHPETAQLVFSVVVLLLFLKIFILLISAFHLSIRLAENLLILLRAFSEPSKIDYLYTILICSVIVSMSHFYCWKFKNSSFALCLSESQGILNLAQICQNSKAKIWKPTESYRFLFCDKARCFSQSKRALYGNFIIIKQLLNCIFRCTFTGQEDKKTSQWMEKKY